MKILFTGGGTGGHVVPIIAIVREIRKIYQKEDLEFFYLGPKDNFGEVLLSQENIKIKNILAGKIRRYSDWKNILQNVLDICFKIPVGIIQSFFYIFFMAPDIVFSKGGFGSVPPIIAAKALFLPVILHESDVTPGMANRFISRFALEIFVSFPKTKYFSLKKMVLVGNPIRREVLEGSVKEAKDFFKLTSGKPVVLILGGSQGAQRINDKILEILSDLIQDFEVIHQTGEKNFETVKAEARVMINNKDLEKLYHPFPFLKEPDLCKAYAAADMIVSRAGSGSIFEIAAVGKPAILIPLAESAQNHQVENAYAFTEKGAGIVIEETNFTSRFFLQRIKQLFSQPEKLAEMKEKSKEFAKPQAGRIIANYLVEYLTKS